jgi:SulP family sulfate permease
VATLFLGIQIGIMTGVVLSIAQIIYQSSRPHVAVLGKLPNSFTYRNVDRFEEAVQHDEVLVYRFDSQLYFGNAAYFREGIEEVVAHEGKELKVFILEANSITDIDSSGIQELEDVISFFKTREIRLFLAGVRGPVRDILQKYGLVEKIGSKNFFLDVHAAVEYYKASAEKENDFWTRQAVQTNVKNKKGGKSRSVNP